MIEYLQVLTKLRSLPHNCIVPAYTLRSLLFDLQPAHLDRSVTSTVP